MVKRLSWNDYFLNIADAVAMRGDCTRRQVGAVIVDPVTKDIIQPGYNGAPPGEPGCLSDNACPRGRHYKIAKMPEMPIASPYEICATCKTPWPCAESVAPSSSYDTGPGSCIAVHAEANAIIRAGTRARGAWLYCTEKPCDGCMKLVKGAGIVAAFWYGGIWTKEVRVETSPVRKLVQWCRRPG